jgi:hypothetical protein
LSRATAWGRPYGGSMWSALSGGVGAASGHPTWRLEAPATHLATRSPIPSALVRRLTQRRGDPLRSPAAGATASDRR